MRIAASLDMYRKVPADLLEGTRRGKILSVIAVVTMCTLFLFETIAFFEKENVSELTLDVSKEPSIRLNFNITMMDLRCDWAVIDVVSALGTEQNVTQHVTKWELDADGVRKRFAGRSKSQKDIKLADETIDYEYEELHEDGEDAVQLDEELFALALKENMFVFVDFYAAWCSHCQTLLPTWESFAELMNDVAAEKIEAMAEEHGTDEKDMKIKFPVLIAKVDCVENPDFCNKQEIRAYPTLRLFVDGKRYGADYHDDRTIEALTNYLATIENQVVKEDGVSDAAERYARMRLDKPTDHNWRKDRTVKRNWVDSEHPGCQIAGYLFLNRAPGNFHIMARSKSHDLEARWTNVSHEIHQLNFGEPWMTKSILNDASYVPFGLNDKLAPLNGNVYVTNELHQAFHHHLKVIHHSFSYKNPKGASATAYYHASDLARIYQVLPQSQLSEYHYDSVPEAKFIYDLSPVAINHKQKSRKWYDYLTSIMAIVGGTFTVVGMLESSIYTITNKKRN